MPLYIDTDNTIQRITFNDTFVAEKPIRESVLRKFMDNVWSIIFGGKV